LERAIPKKISLALLAAALLAIPVVWWRIASSDKPKPVVTLRGSGDIVTIAATGDWLTRGPMPTGQAAHDFAAVAQIVNNASLGMTNLEENLLDEKRIPPADEPGIPRWPYGTMSDAEMLRQSGFTVISLANNHGVDYGADGLKQTGEILDREGLLHAGSGADLSQADMPLYIGTAPHRVAVIAIATSAASESRATDTHGEIQGRPGVNAIRYVPDVTVDPLTFATLQKSTIATQSAEKVGNPQRENQITVAGTVIKKGPRTVVDFVPNEVDMENFLAQIKLAKSRSDIVVVMLHSHEPSNQSQPPAEFVQKIARAAVDAGANLVIGNGPHQLRGIELYKGTAICYSLGNFAYDYSAIIPRAADSYDAGVDLYRLALGAAADSGTSPVPRAEEPQWWESVIAVTTFDHNVLKSIQFQPIDLGVDLPLAQRGIPHLAAGDRASNILQRLSRLSQDLGTTIRVGNGLGVMDLAGQDPARKSRNSP
jgi:poly-gamma-glutamate capsule biosynthesis protein CapA/YwtB (metallophosphatase superfamily)